MKFNTYGDINNKVILIPSGMMVREGYLYKHLKALEEKYYLIFPAYDGVYEESEKEFTSFADQARQIEEYIIENHQGHIHGVYGPSQGGLMTIELMTRNNINIRTAFLDGLYVAHQGKIGGKVTAWMFKRYKQTGKFPLLINIMKNLMGADDYFDLDSIYWDASDETIESNMIQNYTYRTRPDLANSNTFTYLFCGGKEPYAKKSHKIVKPYLKYYDEHIVPDYGHGEIMIKESNKLTKLLEEVFERDDSYWVK